MTDYVFFGTDEFAVKVLAVFLEKGFRPALVVTTPDSKRGRGLKLTPPPVKTFVTERESGRIKLLQPISFDKNFVRSVSNLLPAVFIIASYGKFLPLEIRRLPKAGVLNIHPSLLPRYRGPAPIQSAILNGETETGVTIMLVDEKIDHGPILQAASYKLKTNSSFIQVNNDLAILGANLLLKTLPLWLNGKIKPRAQNEAQATFTRKIVKQDGLVDLGQDPRILDRKFRALTPWPGIYFFTTYGKRVKITDAVLENGKFIIKKVIPESGREIDFRKLHQTLNVKDGPS